MKLSPIAQKMFNAILILSSLLILAGIIYYHSVAAVPFAIGVILTAGLNVLKVKMLDRTVARAVTMEKTNSAWFVWAQYFIRYILTGLILTLAALTPVISLPGAAFGILTWPVATFAMKSFINKNEA